MYFLMIVSWGPQLAMIMLYIERCWSYPSRKQVDLQVSHVQNKSEIDLETNRIGFQQGSRLSRLEGVG
jgi:hypothetical protein